MEWFRSSLVPIDLVLSFRLSELAVALVKFVNRRPTCSAT